ncbi:MAG: hypothetical protein FWF92_08465 [Oscillospiraceae bacterium]|nr:hypothetical protein [Oscillospiraceae bacterium]
MNLSDLTDDEAIQVQIDLAAQSEVYAKRYSTKRYANVKYIFDRRIVEKRAYSMFIRKGGKPQRQVPYYGILSENELEEGYEWYLDCGVIKIPIDEFDKGTLSFTYGDSFPTFKPWMEEEPKYNLYTYDEIIDILKKQGMPPIRTENMSFWTDHTYIETQIWSDETIDKYR